MRIDRLLIIGVSVLAISPVLAATEICRSVSSDQERLACFDRESLPVQGSKRQAKAKEEATGSKFVDPVDSLKAENDRVSARLKGICRGC
jgi:hypothetical protein